MSNLNAGKTTLVTLSTALVLSMFMFAKTADSSFASAKCNEQNSDNNPNCSSSTPTPTPTGTQDASKVYVCKYVGTPVEDETLQTGQNPIETSVNALPDGWAVGSYFNDQHGRSYVLALSPQDPEPTVDDCPQNGVEPTPVATPTPDASATPFVSPVCTGDTHLDAAGKNCVNFEFNGAPASNGSNGQVLGASTMAGTGSFEESLYQGIMTLGATLSAFGIKGLKKAKKVSKK